MNEGVLSRIQPRDGADMCSTTNVTQGVLTSQSASADHLVSIC